MKVLAKVFRVIEILKNNKGMKLGDISAQLDIPKSTIYRILDELIKNKYAYKDNNNYRLGFKFVEVSSYIIERFDLRDISKNSIDKLNDLTKETIHLAVLLEDQMTYIDKRESMSPIRMVSEIGRSGPIHCTALGKVLLAYQPKKVIDDILNNTTLKRFTKNTIVSKELILKELNNIRRNGYSVDNEEHEKNIGCIASPIFNNENKIIGSLSISGVLINKKIEEILKYKDFLKSECKKISKRLGFIENGKAYYC